MSSINLSGCDSITSDGSLYESVNISGSGKISGSIRCLSFHASGSSKVNGDVFCEGEVHCSGAGKFEGSVECKKLHASGACRITKNLKCTTAHLSGSCKVEGSAECDAAKISGVSTIGGSLTFRELSMSGVSKILGDASGENVRISGPTVVGGLLNAENIEIKLGGEAVEIKEIGCTNINVELSDSIDVFSALNVLSAFGISFGNSSTGGLRSDVIEGDEVNLLRTKAKIVRGNNVRIGKGCDIERIEYSGTLVIDEDAKVGEYVKI